MEMALPPKPKEIVRGKVVAIERSSLFLDLGPQGIGIICGPEFSRAKDVLKKLKIGDELPAKIKVLENENGYRELSVIDATKEICWKELAEIKEKGEVIEAKIKKANKGGLISEIKGIAAFLPVSHLAPEHYPKIKDGDLNEIAKALQKFIGQTLKVKIIALDPKKEKLIISEKSRLTDRKILGEYQLGEIVNGEITGLTTYGAFVKIDDNTEGLLYPSEIPQEKGTLENTLKIGQQVKVKIVKIADNRLYLSLKL